MQRQRGAHGCNSLVPQDAAQRGGWSTTDGAVLWAYGIGVQYRRAPQVGMYHSPAELGMKLLLDN